MQPLESFSLERNAISPAGVAIDVYKRQGGGDISAAGLGGPRQRRTGGVEVQRFDGERGVQDDLPPVLGQQIRAVLHGVGPVSYTHLDVYKRQVSHCVVAR